MLRGDEDNVQQEALAVSGQADGAHAPRLGAWQLRFKVCVCVVSIELQYCLFP